MKFSITHLFSKCDQIRSFLQIYSHLLKTSAMEVFIFCAGYMKYHEITSLFDKKCLLFIGFNKNLLTTTLMSEGATRGIL